jgi:Cartilage oligomeric matrix protein
MNDLIALIKKLQQDIANQRGDIARLTEFIQNCAGCREGPPRPPQEIKACGRNPCFPGKYLCWLYLI